MASSAALTTFSHSSAMSSNSPYFERCNFTSNNGTLFSQSSNFKIDRSSFIFNDSSIISYVKGPLSVSCPKYFIIGCQSLGTPGESEHIVRRFTTEEERDRFDLLLQRFGWSAFTMKPLWKETFCGDPCLVLSSAAVYTLRDMLGERVYRWSRVNMSIKISAFFMSSSEVYPGRWDWKKLWKNEGPYEELKLFDRYGNFIVDVELLEARGLLFHGYTEFQMHGDTMLAAKMIGDLNEMKRLKGNAILSQSLNRHLKEVEPDAPPPHFVLSPFPFDAFPPPDDDFYAIDNDRFQEISDSEICDESSNIEMVEMEISSDDVPLHHLEVAMDYAEIVQSEEPMDIEPGIPEIALASGFCPLKTSAILELHYDNDSMSLCEPW